jgi:hypothetical protein
MDRSPIDSKPELSPLAIVIHNDVIVKKPDFEAEIAKSSEMPIANLVIHHDRYVPQIDISPTLYTAFKLIPECLKFRLFVISND